MSFRDLFRVTPLMKAAFGTVKTSLFSLRTVVFKKPVRFRDDDNQSESAGMAEGGAATTARPHKGDVQTHIPLLQMGATVLSHACRAPMSTTCPVTSIPPVLKLIFSPFSNGAPANMTTPARKDSASCRPARPMATPENPPIATMFLTSASFERQRGAHAYVTNYFIILKQGQKNTGVGQRRWPPAGQ